VDRSDDRSGEDGGEGVAPDQERQVRVDLVNVAHAAAQDEDVWVDSVDDD